MLPMATSEIQQSHSNLVSISKILRGSAAEDARDLVLDELQRILLGDDEDEKLNKDYRKFLHS